MAEKDWESSHSSEESDSPKMGSPKRDCSQGSPKTDCSERSPKTDCSVESLGVAKGLEDNRYPMHKSVFNGDTMALIEALITQQCNIREKDKQGNTALHLAVMLGRAECVRVLLAHGAPMHIRNYAGWTPMAEAISYGHRPTILALVRRSYFDRKLANERRIPKLVAALQQIGDFYMELKWDFQSWVPLVSRILPSDVCKIYKNGACIRVDSTLMNFSEMRWERGDVSFIFNGRRKVSKSLIALDNKDKVYQRVGIKGTELEVQDEVDRCMSTDMIYPKWSTKNIAFHRTQTGWFFREDKKEMVGGFNAECYQITGLVLESKRRREHLSEEDLRMNKALMETLTKGGSWGSICDGRRASLNPPPEPTITWEEYVNAPPGKPPQLGRSMVYKEMSKSFKATVAMSPNFPLTVEMLLHVLDVVSPFKHFDRMKQFVKLKLPPGFPIKIDIPILPTVSAKVTFQEFAFRDDIDSDLFQIPSDYVEDPKRFPEL